MGGRGGRGGKRLEGLFGVLAIALIIQVRSFLANPYRYVWAGREGDSECSVRI